ncbi:DUF1905 domain-containing protein [Belliella aquatica]|uniref:DUF1905 domain-containing protein n=1 Tax=Belliella aquatica TaxID=1323734 RepID=A0ABQ1M6H0_9BACT|nr:DUF1905 domain-containing protein [Belliella aquatica]MCH7404739.1 DUF1905 domain-containing protein [Belliella aquatica]GGC34474.1 hypothetical protein GCM10010993_11770 [Belliella aquatica]
MNYLIKEEKLELKYVPGKGAWTYHITVPNTKSIKGKWGEIKVSGSIDGYPTTHMNLAPMGREDRRLSINAAIRKAIHKTGGDTVSVTLYLDRDSQELGEKEIRETFRESGVLEHFESLSNEDQKIMIGKILAENSDEKQLRLLVSYIEQALVPRMG